MYSETCQIISHMGSPVQESCTPGSTGGVLREGHVYQPKSQVRILRGACSAMDASSRTNVVFQEDLSRKA